jgi:hypothetical protein
MDKIETRGFAGMNEDALSLLETMEDAEESNAYRDPLMRQAWATPAPCNGLQGQAYFYTFAGIVVGLVNPVVGAYLGVAGLTFLAAARFYHC